MSDAASRGSEAEQRSVRQFLEGIIRNAELDADRVAALLKQQGFKPLPQSKRPAPSGQVPTGPVADMLLNLAAAMRLRNWEEAGITSSLPADLPDSATAMGAATDAANERAENPNEIPVAVFKALLLHIGREGQTTIGADVALPVGIDADELFERLADFLHAHRHLMHEEKDAKPNGT